MKIAEIFYSIQGEGILTGVPSAFVRTSGCNLRCHFCDTDYTSWNPGGETMTQDAILGRLDEYPTRHVVLTGGEPLLPPEIVPLSQELRRRGYHITIETSATIYRPVECDLASLSPKLANSTPHEREGGRYALKHESQRLRPEVIREFMSRGEYQLKFVVDTPADVEEIRALLAQLGKVEPGRVLLMPQGVTKATLDAKALWLVDLCKQHGYRYCPRLHIDLFGNKRGT
jgi:7-carboxy-7-deazaguanine synthase